MGPSVCLPSLPVLEGGKQEKGTPTVTSLPTSGAHTEQRAGAPLPAGQLAAL